MKAFQKFLVLLIIIGLAAAYFLWPYFEIRRFAAAVNQGDTATVEEMVDMDSMRESVKAMALDVMALMASEQSGGRVTFSEAKEKMQSVMDTPMAKAEVDKMLSGKGLVQVFTTSGFDGRRVPMTWRNEEWTGPINFRVQDSETSGRLRLQLKGTKWKVVGLDINEADLREGLIRQGRLKAGATPR